MKEIPDFQSPIYLNLKALLYGVEALELRAFFVVAVVVLCAAVTACMLPAMRASRVDPIEALRTE